MRSITGVFDGQTIKATEAFQVPPNTKVIITFLDEDDEQRALFPPTRFEDVAGSLPYRGAAKTIEEMDEGVLRRAKEQWR